MAQDTQLIFDKLMQRGGIDGLSDEIALSYTGRLIDVSTDLAREDGIGAAMQCCDQLAQRELSEVDAVLVEYFRANCWEGKKALKHREKPAVWDWEQSAVQQQIRHLRRSMQLPGYEKLDVIRQCQIQTNLGNQLSHIGRFVEAVSAWECALTMRPQFAMALGNLGMGFKHYGHALYDPGHAQLFFVAAHEHLSAAISRH